MRRIALVLVVLAVAPASAFATWSVVAVDRSTGRVVIASATCVNGDDDFLKNVQAVVNLARAHAMAYTLRSEEVPTGKGGADIWFGYEPKLVPFGPPAKTDDAEKLKAAKAHLEKAVALYRRAVELDPKNQPARLGLV